MVCAGGSGRSGARGSDARNLISVAIDLPDHGRPRNSDVSDHLAPYLGSAGHTLRAAPGSPVPADVNIVWPSVERPWTTAYTVGASFRPMAVPPESRSSCSPYIELLLRLPPSWAPERTCPFCEPPRSERHPLADLRTAWPFEWLARLARAPHLERSFLGPGHVVEYTDEAPREHGLPFSGFYFDPGWDEAGDRAIPPLVRRSGARVQFLGVVPLHSAEVRAFRDGRGDDVVRGLDAARVTDLLVPDRPSCVAAREV